MVQAIKGGAPTYLGVPLPFDINTLIAVVGPLFVSYFCTVESQFVSDFAKAFKNQLFSFSLAQATFNTGLSSRSENQAWTVLRLVPLTFVWSQ